MQKCNKCEIKKPLTDFYFRKDSNRYTTICKDCIKSKQKLYYKTHVDERKRYYREHKQYFQDYIKNNSWKYKESVKRYYEKHKDRQRERQKLYYREHPDSVKQYNKKYKKHKMEHDEVYKLKYNISRKLREVFNQKGTGCHKKLEDITKLNDYMLYKHLLKTFEENYGVRYVDEPVHIDHKTPLAQAKTITDVILLNHYTNLQLLKPDDNMKKWKHITNNLKRPLD